MAVAKICFVCNRKFSNKSNLNRHANLHKKNTAKNKKDAKHVIADVSLQDIPKHGLHIQTLNKVLWRIVLQLIGNKRLSKGQSFSRKLSWLWCWWWCYYICLLMWNKQINCVTKMKCFIYVSTDNDTTMGLHLEMDRIGRYMWYNLKWTQEFWGFRWIITPE